MKTNKQKIKTWDSSLSKDLSEQDLKNQIDTENLFQDLSVDELEKIQGGRSMPYHVRNHRRGGW